MVRYVGNRQDIGRLELISTLHPEAEPAAAALEPGHVYMASLDHGEGEKIFVSTSLADILELGRLQARSDDVRIAWYIAADPGAAA